MVEKYSKSESYKKFSTINILQPLLNYIFVVDGERKKIAKNNISLSFLTWSKKLSSVRLIHTKFILVSTKNAYTAECTWFSGKMA